MQTAIRLFLLGTVILVAGCDTPPRSTEAVALDVANRADATPSVAASGAFVAVVWGATQDGKTDVFIATSRDAGSAFGPPVQVNHITGEARLGAELPPRVTLIGSPTRTTPEIVVLYTARGAATEMKVARSGDGGQTFATPVALQGAGAEGDRGWPALAVDPGGAAHAIWLDHRGAASARASGHSHSTQTKAPGYDGVAMAQKSALYYASLSSGEISQPRALTSGVCYCCKTAVTAAADGTIYAAWRHVYAGNLRDIAFTVSRDGGRSFTAPIRVSEDGWSINGCPDDGPAVAAGSSGDVHVVWPTVIGGDNPEGAIFYATTRDGARFTPRVRVPTSGVKPSHPQIVSDRSGRIFIAWDETTGGQRSASMRELLRGRDGRVEFGPVIPLAPRAPGTSPMLATTGSGLVAVWTSPGAPSRVMVKAMTVP